MTRFYVVDDSALIRERLIEMLSDHPDVQVVGQSSDAFDADFGQGFFERCVFYDIGADAIDVSGSDVQVRDVRMINLGDKGLSVGENSRVTGERIYIENADFGVASKDLSQAHILALAPGKQGFYNLGNGDGYSVRQVIEMCEKVTGTRIPAIEKPRRTPKRRFR